MKWPCQTSVPGLGARNRGAFTLVEMLVVMAIIAVLAAFLLPALSNAKIKAKSVRCSNNVRQLMLAVSLYTGEGNSGYPYSSDPIVGTVWFRAIAPFYQNKEGIMLCPDFKNEYPPEEGVMFFGNVSYPKPPTGPGKLGGVAYGINGYGIGKQSPWGNAGLGIAPGRDITLNTGAVKTYSVARPSEMMAVGDTMFFWGNAYTYNFMLAIDTNNPVPPDRHKGEDNIAFTDGHVARLRHNKLLADTEENRRRWNVDNEPHNEIVIATPQWAK